MARRRWPWKLRNKTVINNFQNKFYFTDYTSVKHACFGKELREGWEDYITNFETTYRALGISITPKVHNVFYEVKLFIQRTDKPIGLRSEQKFESVHHDMKCTWSWFKRSEGHQDYEEMLTNCACNYNSFHLDLLFDDEI